MTDPTSAARQARYRAKRDNRIKVMEARIAELEAALEEIRFSVEDEGYKVTAGQQPCKHTTALNEIHKIARAALGEDA